MTEDIKCDLESINNNSKFKKSRMNIVSQFSELINFHAKMIQLSKFDMSSSSFNKFVKWLPLWLAVNMNLFLYKRMIKGENCFTF